MIPTVKQIPLSDNYPSYFRVIRNNKIGMLGTVVVQAILI